MKSVCVAALSVLALSSFGKEFEVKITARDRDYRNALVIAPVPVDFPGEGELLPKQGTGGFQRDQSGNVVFVLPELKKGETAVFRAAGGRQHSHIEAEVKDGAATITLQSPVIRSGQNGTVFTYQGAATALPRPDIDPIYKRGGYIHPVFSPSGKLVTDDYSPNHVHHHGIWSPWTKTEFEGRTPDFWNMGQGKGTVEFVEYGDHWWGPVHAGFSAKHRFVDLTSGKRVVALNETWTVTAYWVPLAGYYVFDVVSTQSCATDSALKLPKYHYGGMGLRGNWVWNGKDQCNFLTSEGITDRVKANETRGRWCHLGGEVDGALTGIAILCHPENFRAPQPMRVHPSEPFFCYAPSQLGDWSIEPGEPYVARYRFIVKDGAPDKEELDRLWEDYANPPMVEVRALE